MLGDAFLEAGGIPLFGIGALGNMLGDKRLDHFMAHVGDGFGEVRPASIISMRCSKITLR